MTPSRLTAGLETGEILKDSADREWPGNGLAIVQSNRPEHLRQVVLDHMRRFPLGALEDELVLTQSNGIGRWLQLAMAETPGGDRLPGGLGIGAAVRFELPARFLWEAYRIVLGADVRCPPILISIQMMGARRGWLLCRAIPADRAYSYSAGKGS